jgi:hypothetical protein
MSEALTAAIEAVDAIAQPNDLAAAKVRGLIRGYHERWIDAQRSFTVLSVEDMIQSDLWNPETKRKSRSFTVAGKLDVRAQRHGRNVLIDHKTCSEDITDPNAPYWRQLTIEAQPSHYMLLEWLNGRKVDEAIWDVVRKPGISPKKLTKAEANAAAATRIYYTYRLTDDDVFALNADGRETLAMYEARLTDDCTTQRREHYFQRRTVPRLDDELIEYAQELWEDGQELLHVRSTKRHRRNPGACMNYGRPCRYLGICSGHDTEDSSNWRQKLNVHPELPALNHDGRDVLTNSRLSTFRACRRKHYFDYELGIERVEEDEAESLYLGNLWHTAQEAWWGSFIQQEVADGDSDAANSAGIEFAAACIAN